MNTLILAVRRIVFRRQLREAIARHPAGKARR